MLGWWMCQGGLRTTSESPLWQTRKKERNQYEMFRLWNRIEMGGSTHGGDDRDRQRETDTRWCFVLTSWITTLVDLAVLLGAFLSVCVVVVLYGKSRAREKCLKLESAHSVLFCSVLFELDFESRCPCDSGSSSWLAGRIALRLARRAFSVIWCAAAMGS